MLILPLEVSKYVLQLTQYNPYMLTVPLAQLIGLSANNVSSHEGWIKDINKLAPNAPAVDFPIIGDEDRSVATLYGMLDNLDKTNVDKKGMPFTVRTVFVSKFSQPNLHIFTCIPPILSRTPISRSHYPRDL